MGNGDHGMAEALGVQHGRRQCLQGEQMKWRWQEERKERKTEKRENEDKLCFLSGFKVKSFFSTLICWSMRTIHCVGR